MPRQVECVKNQARQCDEYECKPPRVGECLLPDGLMRDDNSAFAACRAIRRCRLNNFTRMKFGLFDVFIAMANDVIERYTKHDQYPSARLDVTVGIWYHISEIILTARRRAAKVEVDLGDGEALQGGQQSSGRIQFGSAVV